MAVFVKPFLQKAAVFCCLFAQNHVGFARDGVAVCEVTEQTRYVAAVDGAVAVAVGERGDLYGRRSACVVVVCKILHQTRDVQAVDRTVTVDVAVL